jgi:LmbE family N-acetylglucosaminyl deacetylase
MKITVLSPHVDDAVFSLAESMLTWIEDGHEVTVLSVFAGIPFHDEEGRRKHTTLRAEHDRAMGRLGASHVELDFLDDVYKPRPEHDDIGAAVMAAADDPDIWVGPTGIDHPDHRLLGSIAWRFTPAEKTYWSYDEIPYYVHSPAQATHAPGRLGYRTHYDGKLRLIHEYRSQLNDDLMRCLLVPERVWC